MVTSAERHLSDNVPGPRQTVAWLITRPTSTMFETEPSLSSRSVSPTRMYVRIFCRRAATGSDRARSSLAHSDGCPRTIMQAMAHLQ